MTTGKRKEWKKNRGKNAVKLGKSNRNREAWEVTFRYSHCFQKGFRIQLPRTSGKPASYKTFVVKQFNRNIPLIQKNICILSWLHLKALQLYLLFCFYIASGKIARERGVQSRKEKGQSRLYSSSLFFFTYIRAIILPHYMKFGQHLSK